MFLAMNPGTVVAIVLIVLLFVLLLIFISRIRIVRQTQKVIVERLGAYHATWGTGIHFLVPINSIKKLQDP